ncbi:hypothetical protein [Fusobacterium nucleatum]|uniref:hypothetical protein n=1 Tax=Fusobacterium nucleatum TaxID=851 RepID=UPI001C12CCDB|nr:hypothetical protein [Fusobacterium nucleatum]
MAKYTENIRLAQPEGSDYYDIEVFNHNSELIDKKIGEMDNSLSTIKEGATRAKAGIVQLGTEEGKALEGMMLARLAGAYGYGGDIQDEGVKNPNYIYYDRNTRKMYKCLKQNQDISANVTNFIPLDNNSLLERLENLFKIDSHNDITTIKFGNVVIIYGTFRNVRFNESTDIVIPVTFKNASISAIPWHTGTPGNLTTMAYVNGNKITIRINNHDTGLQNASGTFIITGIV